MESMHGNNEYAYHGELCSLLWKGAINPSALNEEEEILFHEQGSTFCGYCRMAPVHVATITGNVSALELLVSYLEKDVNATNERGETALHLACTKQEYQFIEYSLGQGANPNIRDVDGTAALHISIAKHDVNSAKLLPSFGAEPDFVMFTLLSWTPLHYAVCNELADMVEMLLQYGASIAELDANDESPMSLAIERGDQNILTMLILQGNKRYFMENRCTLSMIRHHTKNDASVLHLACQSGLYEIVKLLLEQGVDVDQRDGWGRTALHVTAESGYVSLVGPLLKYGANIDATDKDDKTPLHLAVANKHHSVVGSLIRYGADLETK